MGRILPARVLQHQIENLHLPHRERREEKREEKERGKSGILRHKNVHFGEEDKMYEGAKKEGGEEEGAAATSDRAVEIVVLKTQLVYTAGPYKKHMRHRRHRQHRQFNMG